MDTPKTTTTRAQLAEWLRARLGTDVTVLDYPTMPDDPEDRITAVLLVVRQRIEPGPTLGTYLETHQLWILDPHVDREISENSLDATLDRVLRAIDHAEAQWLLFVDAERDTFADEYPAYRITVTLPSKTETE